MSERIVAVVWYAWVVLVSPARFVVKCTLVFRCVVTVGSVSVAVSRMRRSSYFVMVVWWIERM